MIINPSLKKIYTTVRQNELRQTSFAHRVASAVPLLCFKADVSVYRLSKDLTTAVNDSFTSDRFDLAFGMKHPMSLVVHVELTKVVPVVLSQNIKHVLVLFFPQNLMTWSSWHWHRGYSSPFLQPPRLDLRLPPWQRGGGGSVCNCAINRMSLWKATRSRID